MRALNLLGLTLAAVLAAPTIAKADTGLYIDGAIGQASVDDNGIDDTDTAFRVGAGWRLFENFGTELGYVDLGEVGEKVAGISGSISSDGFYAGLSGKIPLYDGATGFYLNARAGLYFWDETGRLRQGATSVRVDDSGQDLYFGVGAGYDVNEQFGVGVGYDRYTVGDGSADFGYGVLALNGEVRF